MFRRYLFIALAIGVAAGFIGLGSALFTDSKSVGSNTFTSGTVILSTNPTSTVVTYTNMAPGDQFVAPLTVSNDGTLDLRYAISSAATDADGKHLNGQLVLSVKTDVTTCTTGGFASDGTSIYSGVLGTTGGGPIIGNPTTGADTGDRDLAAGAGEVLCFKVSLPSNTGNAFQGAATTATFTFDAEQTKNN